MILLFPDPRSLVLEGLLSRLTYPLLRVEEKLGLERQSLVLGDENSSSVILFILVDTLESQI